MSQRSRGLFGRRLALQRETTLVFTTVKMATCQGVNYLDLDLDQGGSETEELFSFDNQCKAFVSCFDEALNSTNNSLRLQLLEKCGQTVLRCHMDVLTCINSDQIRHRSTTAEPESESMEHTHSIGKESLQSSFMSSLLGVLDLAIIPEQTNREFGVYEKADFRWEAATTKCVLTIFHNLFTRLKSLHGQCQHFNSHKNTGVDCVEPVVRMENCRGGESVDYLDLIILFLPKLTLVIAANIKCPVWSSSDCQNLCMEMMNLIMCYFKFTSFSDVLKITHNKFKHNSLLDLILNHIRLPLSKDLWEKNPFMSEAFCWIISQVSSPYKSDSIDQIMAVSLNFLHDHQTINKIRGVQSLNHLLRNVSSEEMRWYNRAEVVFDALKTQMYCKDAELIEILLPCLFCIVLKLEKTPEMDHHQEILERLLQDTDGENVLLLRRVYIRNVADFVLQMGIYCTRHLPVILRVVENYLSIDDGVKDEARLQTLQLLENTMHVAWPRILGHSETITRCLLKILVDINCPDFSQMKEESVITLLNAKIVKCFKMLIYLCPDVEECLQKVRSLDSIQSASDVFNSILSH